MPENTELPPGISVVVPVYNSEASLALLAERLLPILQTSSTRYEMILVNDDSRDNSWDVVTQLAEKYDWVRGLNLMRNYGQHNALLCGVRAARFDTILTIDDDLQHPPEEVPRMLEKLREGHDVVYGYPQKQQHGFLRDMASLITKLMLQNAMGADTARHVSAFRVFRTDLRRAFADYRSSFVSLDVLLTWGSTKFAAIQVRHEPRQFGVSNYTLKKLVAHMATMLTGFSTLPLQLASMIGFAFTLIGMAVLLFVVVRYMIQGTNVAGFPFLACIITIFSGAQLFALGIIGEYLARMHFRMMGRPTYVAQLVKDEISLEKYADDA